MADGESSDQNQHLLPVFKHVNRRQSSDEQKVVEGFNIEYVFPAYSEIKAKVVQGINIISPS